MRFSENYSKLLLFSWEGSRCVSTFAAELIHEMADKSSICNL